MPTNDSQKQSTIDIQDRDIWLLEAIAKMRFIQVANEAKLHFDGSADAAGKRLRRLEKAGLVQKWEKAYNQKHVYAVTPAGLRTVAEHDGDDLSHVTVPKQLSGNLEHIFLINQCRIALALELPKAGGELDWWRSDSELRAIRKEPVIPDAVFRIAWQSGESQACALEVENQTRDPQKFLKKILAYAPYKQLKHDLYGLSDFMLLVVCQREQQADRYRQELTVIQSPSWIWLITVEALTQSSGLIPTWQPASGGALQSLQDLATPLPENRRGSGV